MLELKHWHKVEYRSGDAPVSYRADGATVVEVATGKVLGTEGSPQGAALKVEALNKQRPAPDTRPAITMELRRLKRAEAKEFQRKFAPMQKALMKAGALAESGNVAEQFEGMEAVAAAIPEEDVAQAFEKNVRKVGGLAVEGVPITTGPELFEVADDAIVMFVVSQLYGLIRLSEVEGKGSASSSTSSGAGLNAGTSSAATCTASEAGTTPSTATAPGASVPSGAPAQ